MIRHTLTVHVPALEQFLKHNSEGKDVVQALRLRTMIHFFDPEMDRLSRRVLKAYAKFCELAAEPFSVLDAGCMCGFFRHFILQRKPKASYHGIDKWQEALEVARDFQPGISVAKLDFLVDEMPRDKFDYVWCSNIAWFGTEEIVLSKLVPLARRSAFFAQPQNSGFLGDFVAMYGKVKTYDCGETTLYEIIPTS